MKIFIYFGVDSIPSKERTYSSSDCYFKFEDEFISISRECKYMYDKRLQL